MGAVSLVHSIGNIAHETTTKSEISMKTLFLTLSVLFIFASCKNNPTQRNQMNEKPTNKQEVLALGIRQQLNIPQDLILPFDSVGMDSLFGEYKRNVEMGLKVKTTKRIALTKEGWTFSFLTPLTTCLNGALSPYQRNSLSRS